jgi:hypothetical protein
MANVNISQLPAVTTMKGTDEFPIGRDGITTNKVTYNTLTGSIISNLGITIKDVSLNENGYLELSNGLILQWGKTLNTVGTDNTAHNQNFHKPFVSAPYVVVIGTYTSSGTGDGSQRMGQVVSWDSDSFTWFSDNLVATGGNAIGIHWFSIGV